MACYWGSITWSVMPICSSCAARSAYSFTWSQDRQRAAKCGGNGPTRDQCPAEYDHGLADCKQADAEQRVLQPDGEHIVDQIDAVGIGRQTVERPRAPVRKAQADRQRAEATRRAGDGKTCTG